MRTLLLPFRPRGQRGSGIGSLFARLGSFVKPLLRTALRSSKPIAKKLATQLAKEGLSTATSTVADVASGMPVKEAFKKNANEGITRVKGKIKAGVKRKLANLVDTGVKRIKRNRQKGRGRRVKRAKKRKLPSARKKNSKRRRQRRRRQKRRRPPVKKGRPYKGIFS